MKGDRDFQFTDAEKDAVWEAIRLRLDEPNPQPRVAVCPCCTGKGVLRIAPDQRDDR